jgi:hypothetical protein
MFKFYDNFLVFADKLRSLSSNLFSLFFIKAYLSLSLLLNLTLWYFASFMYRNIGQDIAILHYNVDMGISLIGHKNNFFFIPFFSLFFILSNIIILLFLLKKEDFKFLAYFLLSFLVLFNIFSFLALLSIYLVNF